MRSITNRIAVCVATAALASGAIVAVTSGSSAHAATTACGLTCTELYNQQYGNADILYADSATPEAGVAVRLAAAGEVSEEDFVLDTPGTVAQFYQAGIVSSAVNQAWPTDKAYEVDYAPNGDQSNYCLGIANGAFAGESVTLQPCGVNADTLWIGLAADKIGGYEPLVSATTSEINDPYVLTSHAVLLTYRGFSPLISLFVDQLTLVDGAFAPYQMWDDEIGVVGHNPLP
jgi:hypothetical protein